MGMSQTYAVAGIHAAESPLTEPEIRQRVRDLPPSATFVAIILEANGPLSTDSLSNRSLLSVRTVRYALDRLDDEGLIETRTRDTDGRTRVYRLVDEPG